MDAWIQDEMEDGAFGDIRLGERLAKLLGNLSRHVGQSIPLACQDWAATKAAYRFLDNPRVDSAGRRPPIGKQRKYPALTLSVVHAREKKRPKNRERIEWKLLTDLPVSGLRSAVEKLDWYALRWKIETFFKILKSGCKAEEAKLRTATRLTNLISIYSIVSCRIFWLCMINRTDADAPATLVFTKTEQRLLDYIDPKPPDANNATVSHYYLHVVARLGGYLSRARDRPPETWSSGEASIASSCPSGRLA